jgi:hypothetical protein
VPKKSRLLPVETFIEILSAQGSPLIGGQAVNLWATLFQRDCPEIRNLAPFVSRDCDLLGDRNTLVKLTKVTGVDHTATRAGSASPVVGHLVLKNSNGQELLIEVLHAVRGLTPKDIKIGKLHVEHDGKKIFTLSPIAMLKGKIANARELPQKSRQDVHHIKILILCVAHYISIAVERCKKATMRDRELVNILGVCWDVITSEVAREVAQEHSIDFIKCFPQSLRDLNSPKVNNFLKYNRLSTTAPKKPQ